MNEKYYWHGPKLREEFLNVENIKRVRIAVAYFSRYGLELLHEIKNKYNLNQNKIEVYLSPEFSQEKPDELLEELLDIAKVSIVYGIRFHSKVYIFETSGESRVIFGSSNLTKGGIEDNIEFNMIKNAQKSELEGVKIFFEYIKNQSQEVDDAIIQSYRDVQEKLKELRRVQREIKNELYKHERADDPFSKDSYDLEESYFTFEDYETFFSRNTQRDDLSIMNRRKDVQSKMLALHERVYSKVKENGLDCHRKKANITSLTRPCVYNHYQVGWMGVRYGKKPAELDELNYNGEKDDILGFQKHACLQFALSNANFEVNLFHAVAHDAVDRAYLHEQIQKVQFQKKLVQEIRKLKGNDFIWSIYESHTDQEQVFRFDMDEPEDFLDFYMKYDKPGSISSLSKYYDPDDEKIQDIDSLEKEILSQFSKLYDLYNLVAFRI